MGNLIDDRPYAGNWSTDILNKHRKVTTWTPDAIVLFNGDTKIAGCNECKNFIDFQAFITSVGVSAGVDGSMSADVSLSIPIHYGDAIFKDGEFILTTGIEVNVYYRGFFEISGLSPDGDTIVSEGGVQFDLSKTEMRPYYPVFHGVVTSVSWSGSGGFYTSSLSCASMLHFWENQKVNTNAAYLAAMPAESKGSVRLDGHVYTNMTPHQIIYSLYRDSGGTAGDGEWVFSSRSNQTARAEGTKESLFSLSLRYWENRFAQGLYGLRMYGASGALYTSLMTAYLGNNERGKKLNSDIAQIYKGLDTTAKGKVMSAYNAAEAIGLVEKDSSGKIINTPDLEFLTEIDDSGKPGMGLLSKDLKAFITDIGAIGSFDLFNTSYESKLSIAQTVAEKCGFEFYQDVDGDLVFKPPFYNLDTSSSRVYRIQREDIIDISFDHSEPEYTYAVCKGGMFRNTAGLGMEGTWGVKGTYVDYRLVAKYGWKPLDFDSTFFNTARQAFFAAVVELEKKNVGMNSCSLTIPMRAELKPGYPVYIEHIDCYYYVTAVQHSFSFGGDCTTGLTLTARRKKFLPPGHSDRRGVESVDLTNPYLPPKSLIIKDREGFYKTLGFPNVVMALDTTKMDPISLSFGLDYSGALGESATSATRRAYRNMLVMQAGRYGILKLARTQDPADPEEPTFLKGPWILTTPDDKELPLSLETHTYKVPAKKTPPPAAPPTPPADGAGGAPSTPNPTTPAKTSTRSYQTLRGEAELSKAYSEYQKATASTIKLRNKNSFSQAREDARIAYERAKTSLREGYRGQASILDLIDSIQKMAERDALPQAGSTSAILQHLSSKKASFNPNQPGYYCYFSSSHPDSEQQAPHNLLTTSSYFELQELRADNTKLNMVRDSVGGATNEVSLSEEAIQPRGFLTRTRYSFQPAIVPTKDILTLSFQDHGVVRNPPALEKQIVVAPELSDVLTKYKKLFTERVKNSLKRGAFASAIKEAAYPNYYEWVPVQNGALTEEEVKLIAIATGNNPDFLKGTEVDIMSAGVSLIPPASAPNIINATWGKIEKALRAKYEPDPDSTELDLTVGFAAQEELEKLMGGAATEAKAKPVEKEQPLKVENSWKSPIFPVSDENGYEVYGAYQYGRGLDIVPGGAFDTLLKQDVSRVLTDKQVDEYIQNVLNDAKRTNAARTAASSFTQGLEQLPEMKERLSRVLEERGSKGSNFEEKLANAITTRDNRQVINNTPIRLSDINKLSTRDASCDCRGDTSDIQILMAEEFSFLQVEDPNALGDSQIVEGYRKTMENRASDWLARQAALRGNTDVSQTGTGSAPSLSTISRAADQLSNLGQNTAAGAANLRAMASKIGN